MKPEPEDWEEIDSIDLTRYDSETRRAIVSIIETLREMDLARERRASHEYRVAIGESSWSPFTDDESTVELASASLGLGTKMIPSVKYGIQPGKS